MSSSCPGSVAVASRAPDPLSPGPQGAHTAPPGPGPVVRGRRQPASPPLSRHLPSRPGPALPRSHGPLGPRPRPGSGAGIAAGAVGDREPGGRQRGRRARGHLRTQVSGGGAGRTGAGRDGGWSRCGLRGRRGGERLRPAGVPARKGPGAGRGQRRRRRQPSQGGLLGRGRVDNELFPLSLINQRKVRVGLSRGLKPICRGTSTCLGLCSPGPAHSKGGSSIQV